MASNKFVQLLEALKTGTENKRVLWQDLPDEEMFRAQVAGGMVRIGKLESPNPKGYILWVMKGDGAIIGELEIRQGEEFFPLIDELYGLARLRARNGETVLDSMIRTLK